MSLPTIALIAGATGLTGEQLLKKLLDSPDYTLVISLQRKPSAVIHPKLQVIQTDFSDLETLSIPEVRDVFCCLGTTIKKAGSKKAFIQVDYEYPLALARLAVRKKAAHFLIITAMGANASSAIFYNRVKGGIEKALAETAIPKLSILRPSLLLGERNEKRGGEKIGALVAKILNPVMIGALKKYRGIKVEDVASAMLQIAARPAGERVHIYLSDRLQEIAANRYFVHS